MSDDLPAKPPVHVDDDGLIRVAVIGSRNYPEPDTVDTYMRNLPANVHVISGGAAGVDKIAATVARQRQMRLTEFKVDTTNLPKEPRERLKEFRRRAFARNREIVFAARYVVAFWDGTSNGTRNAVKQARELERPVMVILPKGMDPKKHQI